ncbi:MAG: hypothetical protein ACK5H1_00205 [Tenacibaculum sp.]
MGQIDLKTPSLQMLKLSPSTLNGRRQPRLREMSQEKRLKLVGSYVSCYLIFDISFH